MSHMVRDRVIQSTELNEPMRLRLAAIASATGAAVLGGLEMPSVVKVADVVFNAPAGGFESLPLAQQIVFTAGGAAIGALAGYAGARRSQRHRQAG